MVGESAPARAVAVMKKLALCAVLVACGGDDKTAPDASTLDASTDASTDGPLQDVLQTDATADVAKPHLKLDLSATSVSGISSGGFMAVQFHVAFSSEMKGAAIFAGGPYMCSMGSLGTAESSCAFGLPAPNVAALVAFTHQNATAGSIDDPTALGAQRVFLFGGADDTVVNPVVMDALQTYYAAFMASTSIDYVSRRPGTSHTWPTLAYGNPCDVVASPFIGSCNYDGAGLALSRIYGTLSPRATTLSGAIVPIAQTSFIADTASHSLADQAFAYVPAACSAGETCKVHVAFHGCLQSESQVKDAFYAHSGLNEWADTNHIVVLYPQTIASNATPANPEGCWDFWGYESPDFAKKTGPQLAMVHAMIAGLAQ